MRGVGWGGDITGAKTKRAGLHCKPLGYVCAVGMQTDESTARQARTATHHRLEPITPAQTLGPVAPSPSRGLPTGSRRSAARPTRAQSCRAAPYPAADAFLPHPPVPESFHLSFSSPSCPRCPLPPAPSSHGPRRTSLCPLRHAQCSGVLPWSLGASGLCARMWRVCMEGAGREGTCDLPGTGVVRSGPRTAHRSCEGPRQGQAPGLSLQAVAPGPG